MSCDVSPWLSNGSRRIRGYTIGLVLGLSGPTTLLAEERSEADGLRAQAIQIWVDEDDDDRSGSPDFSAPPSGLLAGDERILLPQGKYSASSPLLKLGEAQATKPGQAKRVWLQALRPGLAELTHVLGEGERRTYSVQALRALRVDQGGRWSAPLSGSVSRQLPPSIAGADPEAFRIGIIGPNKQLPGQVWLRSFSRSGAHLDALGPLRVQAGACPKSPPVRDSSALACGVTKPIRLVTSSDDKWHPGAGAALQVELTGRVELSTSLAQKNALGISELHVLGPDLGPDLPRLGRVQIVGHILRTERGGMPAIGGHDDGALEVLNNELRESAGVWAQCGLELDFSSRVVDPPEQSLIAVGCEDARSSAGGSLALSLDGKPLRVSWPASQTPLQVANKIREEILLRGYQVQLSRNPKASFSALPSADLVVRHPKSGALVAIEPLASWGSAQPLSTDGSLPICLGELNLGNGLTHFNDFNSSAGSLEERSLLKPLGAFEASKVHLVLIPSFAGAGRIGESFVYSPGAVLRNIIMVDRAGLRSGSQSFVLAHELGHVLLHLAGHPDDFGVDKPSLLMDADAADPTIFGPRRLTLGDCKRVWQHAGELPLQPLVQALPTKLPRGN